MAGQRGYRMRYDVLCVVAEERAIPAVIRR